MTPDSSAAGSQQTRRVIAAVLLVIVACRPTMAQQSTSTRPVTGLRGADPAAVWMTGGEVVAAPGEAPVRQDILIRGTTIVEVGSDIQPPAGADHRDVSGKRIYAGLVDAMHEVDLPDDPASDSTAYWNKNITPGYRAAWVAGQSDNDSTKLRSQGITARLLAPRGGIIKGTSCLVLMGDADDGHRVLRSDVFQHATLTVPRGKSRDRYPNSPMGATALLRQALHDALWYREANRTADNRPTLSRPQPNAALQQISGVIETGTLVIDSANERMTIRAADVADEFSLDMIVRGSGREYRSLDQIAQKQRVVLCPVNFPTAPPTTTTDAIRETSLVDWMHWHFAPENPSRLDRAGVTFCLTTDGLDDPSKFLKQVRTAVARGLDPSVAHAAITTTPAKLMGVDDSIGRVKNGMLANLIVTDGDLFDDKTKVLETWVAGQRYDVEDKADVADDPLIGSWTMTLPIGKPPKTVLLELTKKKKQFTAKMRSADSESAGTKPSESKSADAKAADAKPTDAKPSEAKPVELKNVIRSRDRLTASLNLGELNLQLSSDEPALGVSHLTMLVVPSPTNADSPTILATLTTPDGQTRAMSLRRPDEVKKQDSSSDKTTDASDVSESEKPATAPEFAAKETIPLLHPLGAYGIEQPVAGHKVVLFRGATVWTCGDQGKIEDADVLVRDGRIAEVGADLKAPTGCHVVTATGKHITPGLIDCHSHIATDGGINESSQAVTAEVRIGDFIDNTDIAMYRQLAGGVTTANILHGSANPIGGQSQTIKFRWGESMQRMKFEGAPAGIKFALGENVKRTTSRYPNTRMGVEQILRDQFLAARQYRAAQQNWQAGHRDSLPPRRDLQLDAIVEIQQGDRWVHCHSYRQDEIVATLDVLEEFNVQIGTLQHILEGYKVADRIVQHGAMASSFSDWWAYKFEVYDAIPYNGVLMHDAGVIVSYNSDDAEMGRHLNTEAAKAIKYGGVAEQEALKFVTLNPAKQLRIDHRVGSIEVGKDADLVVWSGPPMSTTTRCEQTWIDGRNYFSLDADQEMRKRDARLKAQLVQRSMDDKPKADAKDPTDAKDANDAKSKTDEEPEAERWVRYDVFCNAGQIRNEENK